MGNTNTKNEGTLLSSALCAVLAVVFAALGWLAYNEVWYKGVTILAGVGILALLWLGDLKRLGKLPSLLLLAHAAFTMLSIFWAVSGKFFLGRYPTTFIASFFFLYAVLRGKGSALFARRAMSVSVGISTIYAVLGVEAVSTGVFKAFSDSLFGEGVLEIGMRNSRLYGVFANCNIEASFYALGILLSVALICANQKKPLSRAFWMFALVCNAYAMILGISIGAIGCFAVAVVVYLIAAGKERGAVLSRMLLGAAASIAAVLVEIGPLHNARTAAMWLVMFAFAALAAFAEMIFGERFASALSKHEKATIGASVCVLALAAAYLIVGAQLTGPHTFTESSKSIQRSAVLKPGEQTITLDADEGVKVTIESQSLEQVMTSSRQKVYEGTAQELNGAKLDVSQDSVVCIFTFSGKAGQEIRSVVSGSTKVPLGYTILPNFIARRLVNLSGSHSVLQRVMYWQDSLKLFRLSPLVGLGDGAFGSAITFVQSYEYESVHSHNQFLESLIEGGIIGFVLFTGAVVVFGVSLVKARKKERKNAWLYPVLCAEFTMSTLQMFWDVTMFVAVFAAMIYMLYGVIAETCAAPLSFQKKPEDEAELPPYAEPRASAASAETSPLVRVVCCILPLLFIVSVGCNMHAYKLARQKVSSLDEFMSCLAAAEKWDLYEKNDEKLSYVRAAMEYDTDGTYAAQADAYAKELSKVQSNSIPYILMLYYLSGGRYYEAVDEAMLAARWSASDSDMWNDCIDVLKQVFIDTGENSPLLGSSDLLYKLMDYQNMLTQRDANSIKPIKLKKNSKAFFEKLNEVYAVRTDPDAMRLVLAGE